MQDPTTHEHCTKQRQRDSTDERQQLGSLSSAKSAGVVEGVGENVTGARPPLLGFGGDK